MTIYYFHESCYNKLLGPKVGGRTNLHKIETKVFEAEDKRREIEQKRQWQLTPNITYSHNDQQFRDEYMCDPSQRICERCGLGMVRKFKNNPFVWICPNHHTEVKGITIGGIEPGGTIKDSEVKDGVRVIKNLDLYEVSVIPEKHPKAHVEEFEPSQDTKDDHLNLIIAEIRTRGPLSSEQLEGFLGIKRSTITWRLWDNTVGNTKSKNNQELFYFDKGPKGVQYYGLVNERIKDPNIFAKARLEQQAKENGISYEEAKTLYDVDFGSDDTDYPMTTNPVRMGSKEKPYTYDDIKEEENEMSLFIHRMLQELKIVDFNGFMTTIFHFTNTNQRLHGLEQFSKEEEE